MTKKLRSILKLFEFMVMFGTLMFLGGCTSPLWWQNPERGFIYKGWFVNIVDQVTVARECNTAIFALGCVKPAIMTAFSVNNPYVLVHECQHIDAIMEGEGTSGEKGKDIFLTVFGINDLLTAATILFSAPSNCNDGTMAEWKGNKVRITQASYGRSQILPTLKEWNRLYPDRAMRDSAQLD